MPLIEKIKARYKKYEIEKLAEQPADVRDDILAFDALLKKYALRSWLVALTVWLVAAIAFKFFIFQELSWYQAAGSSFVSVVAISIAFLSAWFGHAKFQAKSSFKLLAFVLLMAAAGGLVGVVGGRIAKVGFEGFALDSIASLSGTVLVSALIAGTVYFGLVMMVLQFRRNQLQRRNESLVAAAQKERLARQLTDAKLKLLQAQVEPHFLFNTLASVQQLAEGRAPEAAELTSQLIKFLRSGLSGLREETSTLRREFQMVEAYLTIMKTRMDARLSFALHLPLELADQIVPPAMLISLVENAIKHGLEPHPPGGTIEVAASQDADIVKLTVTDTGRGIIGKQSVSKQNTESGVGLDNIRERLAAIYSDANCSVASLTTSHNLPSGFVATLSFPALNLQPETEAKTESETKKNKREN